MPALRCAPPPLARNYLIMLTLPADEDRLNDAVGANRGRELLELVLAKAWIHTSQESLDSIEQGVLCKLEFVRPS